MGDAWNRIKASGTNRAQVIEALPKEVRGNFTFMRESEAPNDECVSERYPRAIMFSKDLLVTFNGNPAPGCQNIDVVEYDAATGQATPRSVQLDAKGNVTAFVDAPNAKLSVKDRCSSCHTDDWRGKWEQYDTWPHAFGADDDTLTKNEAAAFVKLRDRWMKKGSPYASLDWSGVSKERPLFPYSLQARNLDYVVRPNLRLLKQLTEMAIARAVRQFERMSHSEQTALLCTLLDPHGPSSMGGFVGGGAAYAPHASALDLGANKLGRDYFDGDSFLTMDFFAAVAKLYPEHAARIQAHKESRAGCAGSPAPKKKTRDLFEEHCSSCHTERKPVLGSPKLKSYLLSGEMPGKRLTDEQIAELLRAQAP